MKGDRIPKNKNSNFILTSGTMITPKGRETYTLKLIDLESGNSKGFLERACHILNEGFNKPA